MSTKTCTISKGTADSFPINQILEANPHFTRRGTSDEGAIFHAIDVLQAFVEKRKGGGTGVKTVQSIRGPETWKWVAAHPWAAKLVDSAAKMPSPTGLPK